jgi:hypothetical protein
MITMAGLLGAWQRIFSCAGRGRKSWHSQLAERDKRAAAERAVAEFLAKGGKINRAPEVVPVLLVCRNARIP